MRLTEEILAAGWRASIKRSAFVQTPEKAAVDVGRDFIVNNRKLKRKAFVAGCKARCPTTEYLLKHYGEGLTVAEIQLRDDKPADIARCANETLRRLIMSCRKDGKKVHDFKPARRSRRRVDP